MILMNKSDHLFYFIGYGVFRVTYGKRVLCSVAILSVKVFPTFFKPISFLILLNKRTKVKFVVLQIIVHAGIDSKLIWITNYQI